MIVGMERERKGRGEMEHPQDKYCTPLGSAIAINVRSDATSAYCCRGP
jgi:hypothetical protein